MSNFTISKTVLALAITAASANAFATPPGPLVQDVSGATVVTLSRTSNTDVTLNGTALRNGGENGVSFEGADVSGNLLNTSTLNVHGLNVRALSLGRSNDVDAVATTIAGNITNTGTLNLLGPGAVGIYADAAEISGNLINTGTIRVTGQGSTPQTPNAIELVDTHLTGGVTNNGKLISSGDGAKGLYVHSTSGAAPVRGSIGGDVVNSGIISVTGANSAGLLLDNVALNGTVSNQLGGVIAADGANATSVLLKDMQYNALDNKGNIQASGANAVAVRIQNAKGPASNLDTNGIINSGVIQSSGTAIKVESTTPSDVFVIHQNGGLISGSNKSISGNGQTELHWTAGTVNGDMEGMKLVQVAGNGSFNGQNIDALLVDVKTGSLYLASETGTKLTGNLNVAQGATLRMPISDTTDNSTPMVTVAGKATFAAGSKVELSAQPGDFTSASDGKTYTLVKAGSIENGGLLVVSDSALLKVSGFTVDGETVKATVTTKTASETITQVLIPAGASVNAQNAMRPFVDTVMGKLEANDIVFKNFANADAAQLAKLAEQLSPVVNGGATQAAMGGQSLISNAVTSRAADARGLSSGDVLKETGVWVKGLYSDADQSTRDGIAGYNAYTNGIIIGADGKLTPDLTLGVAFSHLDTDVNSDFSKTKVTGDALTAYANWTQGPIFVDSSLTFGKNDNESKREVAGTTAKGDYDSDLFGINVLAGYGFNLQDGLLVEPRVAARYANLKIDGYTEKNSSAALSVNGQRMEIGEMGAGVRVAKNFPMGQGTLKPEVTAMAYHDFIGDKANSTSAFVVGGSPFVTSGAQAARDSYELGLAADYSIGAFTVGAAYSYLQKTDFNADTFTLKGRYDF
ncbi:autotransporter outer membrane beta-barrel domain-containing protein [Pseudomonas baetica]|uniref:autotransporter family protein n=1 Tax=Pseudomonas baetica TaxID=674054 RepID=UPI00240585F2|nr:autotransporter outer membrane beta-barrel domain-containing protein [Pseudomonas baetica]MDF9779317.1 outer membrane autotransporter protein [Pseudomonas baetica]